MYGRKLRSFFNNAFSFVTARCNTNVTLLCNVANCFKRNIYMIYPETDDRESDENMIHIKHQAEPDGNITHITHQADP